LENRKIEKEINKPDEQAGSKQNGKNEETVEDEGRIVEENGEIMVREEEKSAEEPELDPKGQSEEDN